MDFLANENIPIKSIRILRIAGYNVVSVGEETAGAKDQDVLSRAHSENRVILTFDRDYGELIYRHKSNAPAGIVYFRFEPTTPEEPAEVLLSVLQKGSVPVLGKFTVIERDRIRQRTLSKS